MKIYQLLYLSVFLFLSTLLTGVAQQRAQYTQYYINPYILNQAAGGTSNYMEASIGYRKQWIGFNDSPSTYYASFFIPINQKSEKQINHSKGAKNHWNTIGGYLYNDVTGPTQRMGGLLSVAHNLPLSRRLRLSFALTAGLQQYSYNTADLEIADAGDIKLEQNSNDLVTDMNMAIWLYHDDFYIGVSSQQLFENQFDFPGIESNQASELVRHHFIQAAYRFSLSPHYELYTTSMVKHVPNTPTSIEVGGVVRYDRKLWVGTNYRFKDALGVIAGFNVMEMFDISYTYEMSLSSITPHTSGTHEFVLIYRKKMREKMMCPKDFW